MQLSLYAAHARVRIHTFFNIRICHAYAHYMREPLLRRRTAVRRGPLSYFRLPEKRKRPHALLLRIMPQQSHYSNHSA